MWDAWQARAAIAAHLAQHPKAEQPAYAGLMLEAADVLAGQNWRGDLVEQLRDAARLASKSPAPAAQPVYFYRQKNVDASWIECDQDTKARVETGVTAGCFEFRTLYAAPAAQEAQHKAVPEVGAIKAAFIAGFKESGEGWNYEMLCDPESDPHFVARMNDYLSAPTSTATASGSAQAKAQPRENSEAHKLAPILWGMCEGGGADKGIDIYAEGYQSDDGDVYVRRAGELLIEQEAEICELLRYVDMLAGKVESASAQASQAAASEADKEVEREAEAIYNGFVGAHEHPWVKGGNSNMQEYARQLAREAIALRTNPATPASK